MRNVIATLPPASTRPTLKLVPASESALAVPLNANQGIEASEAAAAIGLDPAKPQLTLWRAKIAHALGTAEPPEPPSWAETSAQYWRALLEPLVASVYTKRSGNTVRRINLLTRHPVRSWMQARVDWEVLGCPDVDLMCYLSVGQQDAAAWEKGLPAHERVNALHLLAVTGKQAVDLAVLVCGQDLQIHRVARDEPVIARLLRLESRFWRSVELNQPPPAGGNQGLIRLAAQGGEVVARLEQVFADPTAF